MVLLFPTLESANGQGRSRQPNQRQHKAGAYKSAEQFTCLPEGFTLTDIVAYRNGQNGKEENLTIKDKLLELKAECRAGKLIDTNKKEIKFFRLACFGNPPADYEEIMQKQQEELRRLQQQYTVIILECNPHIQ
jgi:hypothetical protein